MNIIDLFKDIENFIKTIIGFFKTVYEIITTILTFLPSPFFEITMFFLVLLMGIFMYRLIKG